MSLSSDARILAVGAPGDDNKIGATWIFLYDGSLYKQLGNKLVGYNSSGFSHQGEGKILHLYVSCKPKQYPDSS